VSAQPPKAFEPRAHEPAPGVRLTSGPPALTETLNSALDRLAEERAQNQLLRETVASQERALTEKDNKVKELTVQLETYDAKIRSMQEALEKWKDDVLGFRDEMRDYEEAQIQVQQEILVLLRGFKKDAQAK
jgi:predicted RNase H-like nuclease (RuvC/YqgF family)